MTEKEKILKECVKACEKREQDASKCKKEWDAIDKWASGCGCDDEYDYCSDSWYDYKQCVDPFQRSKYLGRISSRVEH